MFFVKFSFCFCAKVLHMRKLSLLYKFLQLFAYLGVIIFVCISYFSPNCPLRPIPEEPCDTSPYYARVIDDNSYFYSAPLDDNSAKLFVLPKTYFVQVVGNAGDDNNLFFVAYYMEKNGYVKKSDVQVVDGVPLVPYASSFSFRVFVPSGLDLRSTPSTAVPFNIIINVPYLETNLVYFGSMNGEEMIAQKGTEWYYCKYISGANTYYGYLYAGLCDLLPQIPQNTEFFQPIDDEIFANPNLDKLTTAQTPKLAQEIQILLVIAICIPCVFVIWLLFKPTKLMIDDGQGKKKIKKLKRSEYYELDEQND